MTKQKIVAVVIWGVLSIPVSWLIRDLAQPWYTIVGIGGYGLSLLFAAHLSKAISPDTK